MRWHEITIHTTEQAIEMISNFFHEIGAGGVSIEESGTLNKQRDTSLGQWYELPLNDIPEGEAVIKGYFSEPVNADDLVIQLQRSVRQLSEFGIDAGRAEFETKVVDEEDWANNWKQYFKPIRISERITIKPTWEDYEPTAEELIIELDPGMAFGTGTHATTALCLRALERTIRGGEDVLDVGTGSGILAIGACQLGARHVLAVDLDPVAVSSALENTRLNRLQDRISVRQSDLLQILHDNERKPDQRKDEDAAPLGVSIPVNIVVANLLAHIVILIVEEVYELLTTGGTFISSGIIKSKEDEVEQALLASKFTIVEKLYEEDWVVIVAHK